MREAAGCVCYLGLICLAPEGRQGSAQTSTAPPAGSRYLRQSQDNPELDLPVFRFEFHRLEFCLAPAPAGPRPLEHLLQKPRRQAVGEHRLQVLEGDAVVLALVLLLVPGLGEGRAHRCDGRATGGRAPGPR